MTKWTSGEPTKRFDNDGSGDLLLLDCGTCPASASTACEDCVVTVIVARPRRSSTVANSHGEEPIAGVVPLRRGDVGS